MTLPASGLLHRWQFDEGTGATAGDAAGGVPAAITGSGVWGRQAVDGSAVATFDGTATFAQAAIPAPAGAFTLATVVRPDLGSMKDSRGLLYQRDDTAVGGGYLLRWATGNAVGDQASFSVRNAAGTTTTILFDRRLLNIRETWLVLLAGWDTDGSMFFRINRREYTATGAVYQPSSRDLYIGRVAQTTPAVTNPYAKGRQADVLVWGRYLTSQERSDAFDALYERVNGVCTVTDGAAVTPTILPGPFNGVRVDSTNSNYKQITSDPAHVYIAESVTDGVQRSRLAKLAKVNGSMGALEQSVVLNTVGHDGNVGHRGLTVAVHPSGTVLAHGAKHDSTWLGKHTPTPTDDLTSLASTAAPAAVSGVAQLAYHKMWRLSGQVFMTMRPDQAGGIMLRWNDSTKVWDTVGDPIAQANSDSDSFYTGQGALAANSAGDLFLIWQFRDGGAGHPSRYGLVLKSTDDGATWTDLTGASVTLPATPLTASQAFHQTGDFDMNRPSAGFTGGGDYVAVAPWINVLNGDSDFRLYASTYDPASGDFTRHRLDNSSAKWQNVGVAMLRGMVIVIGNDPDTNQVVAFATLDGQSWVRHVVDNPANPIGGVQVDDRAGELDDRVRFLTCRTNAADWAQATNVAASEVYEFDLPDVPTAPVPPTVRFRLDGVDRQVSFRMDGVTRTFTVGDAP